MPLDHPPASADPLARTMPAKPPTLTKAAAVVWDEVAPALFAAGVLTQLDAAALEAYCRAVERYRHAAAQVDATGGDVVSINGDPKPNPWGGIRDRASKEVLAYARNLGLCPGAPIRAKADGDEE